MNIPSPEKIIKTIDARIPGVIALYLFGSTAHGSSDSHSDIDLAILCETPGVSSETLFETKLDLEEALDTAVDLVDLTSASAVIRAQVFKCDKVLLDRNRTKRVNFESFALANYCELNQQRAAILSDFYRRSSE